MIAFAFFEAATTGLLTCSVTYLNELGLSGQDIVFFILTSTCMGAVGAAGSRRLVPLFGVKRSMMGVLAAFVLLTVVWMFVSSRRVAFGFAFGFGICYGVVHPVQRTGRDWDRTPRRPPLPPTDARATHNEATTTNAATHSYSLTHGRYDHCHSQATLYRHHQALRRSCLGGKRLNMPVSSPSRVWY